MHKCFFSLKKNKYCLLYVLFAICLVSYCFTDIYETMRHGMAFWDALLDGQPLKFYQYSYNLEFGNEMLHGVSFACYDFTVYFIFALWNFPLWLIEHFTKCNVQASMWGMIWAKGLVVLAVFISAKLLRDIIQEMNVKDEEMVEKVQYLYLSSLLIIVNPVSTGQYDILGVAFILFAIKKYLLEKYKWFVFIFSIAVSIKYYPIIVFIPLVLLRQKNILKIIRDIIFAISLTIGEKIIFLIGESASFIGAGAGASETSNHFLGKYFCFLEKGFSLGIGQVSIFAMAYFMICIWCYLKKVELDEKWKQSCITICFLITASFVILCPIHPQWIVIMIPFLYMIIAKRAESLGVNLFLVTVIELLSYGIMVMNSYGTWSNRLCWNMLPYHAFVKFFLGTKLVEGYGIGHVLLQIDSAIGLHIVLCSGLIACFCFLIWNVWFSRPVEQIKTQMNEQVVMKVRFIITFLVSMIPMMLYLSEMIYYILRR